MKVRPLMFIPRLIYIWDHWNNAKYIALVIEIEYYLGTTKGCIVLLFMRQISYDTFEIKGSHETHFDRQIDHNETLREISVTSHWGTFRCILVQTDSICNHETLIETK